ncbi:MAG: NUDIX domain-containing protein [Ilumatobacteraceae bacterium]
MSDELVDVVDRQDRVLRVVTRSEMRRDRLCHRAVFIAISDGEGRILVHRRALTKDIWPGWLDIAVGGVVASGETYDEAAERELAEEVGVSGTLLRSL